MGPTTRQEAPRQALCTVLEAGQRWSLLPSIAQRERAKDQDDRTVSRGRGHRVARTDEDRGVRSPVRHLSIHARALAQHEAPRRQAEMPTIAAAIQRMQGVVNQ
jgi:hypothetical protein